MLANAAGYDPVGRWAGMTNTTTIAPATPATTTAPSIGGFFFYFPVLYPAPHIPPGSRRSGRNPVDPRRFHLDSAWIQVESRWNGRNGRNLVGMKCQWEPTKISPGLGIIPTKFLPNSDHSYQIHPDPHGSQSNQIPSGLQVDSRWIPTKFRVEPFLLHNLPY